MSGPTVPVSEAQRISNNHYRDIVVIYTRNDNGSETVTTYGHKPKHKDAAVQIATTLRNQVVPRVTRLIDLLNRAHAQLVSHGSQDPLLCLELREAVLEGTMSRFHDDEQLPPLYCWARDTEAHWYLLQTKEQIEFDRLMDIDPDEYTEEEEEWLDERRHAGPHTINFESPKTRTPNKE